MTTQDNYIVLLEDDHFQTTDLSNEIRKSNSKIQINKCCCEAEFLDQFEKPPATMPNLFVLDLMAQWQARWIKTERDFPNLPTDRAGIRCLDAVRKYNPAVPVIVYTVVETSDLDKSIFDGKRTFLHLKEENDDALVSLIRRLLST